MNAPIEINFRDDAILTNGVEKKQSQESDHFTILVQNIAFSLLFGSAFAILTAAPIGPTLIIAISLDVAVTAGDYLIDQSNVNNHWKKSLSIVNFAIGSTALMILGLALGVIGNLGAFIITAAAVTYVAISSLEALRAYMRSTPD